MRTILRGVAVLLMFVHWPGSAADLSAFHALYQLTSGSLTVGEISVSLDLSEGGRYRYYSESKPTGLVGRLVGGRIEEESEGVLLQQSLRPERYRYQREGRKKRTVQLKFDWAKQQVVNTINNDPWTMRIEPGTMDKLAVQLALMRDLKAGHNNLFYRVADGGRMKDYRFSIVERGTIETSLGSLDVVRVRRDRGRNGRYTDLWCAEKLDFLPALVVQYRDGKEHARMTLQRFDSTPIKHRS
ncbi:MAG: hypothetical protein Kow006_15670 [Gammaproteobacteria bacterium]